MKPVTDTEKKIAELQQEIERLKEERDAAVEGYQQQVKYAGELMTKLVSAQQELKKVKMTQKRLRNTFGEDCPEP